MHYALITGAAGGIGQALVKRFNESGYFVIATDIVPQPKDLDCKRYFQIDLEKTVEDEGYAKQCFIEIEEVLDGHGLKALINNAAVQMLGGVDSLTRQDWRRTLDVNLMAPFIWSQALISSLEKASGSILNISSIHAKLTKRNFVAYATSKAALCGMTRAMAVDLGPRVRVNAIEPAAIETEMLLAGFKDDNSSIEMLKKCHPLGRIGNVDELAALALTLVSDQFNFMTGTSVALDGGISAQLKDPV